MAVILTGSGLACAAFTGERVTGAGATGVGSTIFVRDGSLATTGAAAVVRLVRGVVASATGCGSSATRLRAGLVGIGSSFGAGSLRLPDAGVCSRRLRFSTLGSTGGLVAAALAVVGRAGSATGADFSVEALPSVSGLVAVVGGTLRLPRWRAAGAASTTATGAVLSTTLSAFERAGG